MDKHADLLLKMIDCTMSDFGRFRSVWTVEGSIIVCTRDGGDNRLCYHEENSECTCSVSKFVPKLPYYDHDKDDEIDCTYALIYFNVPEKYSELLEHIRTGKPFEHLSAYLQLYSTPPKKS